LVIRASLIQQAALIHIGADEVAPLHSAKTSPCTYRPDQ
jgi:hypothetical protein